MSDLKGFSLRTKKNRRGPKDSTRGTTAAQDAPDERSRYALRDEGGSTGNSTDPRAGKSQERLKPGGATSDIVKKRYSIRYAQVPDFGQGDVPSVPGVPRIPQAYAQQGGRDDSPAPATKGDIRVLKDEHMQPEEVVSNFLATATEADIAEYEKSLKKVKNRASTDLQHSVYQNRTQFIKISKEAEKLRTEMQTLRGLMSELTTSLNEAGVLSKGPDLLEVDDGSSSARKRANRSSVANLEAMWNTQLQALWKNIEGSQKSLPIIPGRHIVQESGNWVELDAATWKPRRPVHIVLLNDHLLIATRKRKRVDPNTPASKAPTKLVAERCWPLQDIDMIDLSSGAKEIKGPFQDMNDISNSITVRHGQQSFTYRSDRRDAKDKTNLLLAFKRTLDDLRRAERAEADELGNKSKETMNYLVTRDPAISRSPDLLHSLSNSKNRPEILIDVDGKQRNLRWVEGQIDELDIDIALQRFNEAVDRVEQLRKLAKGLKSNTVAQDLINVKVDERAAKLAELLTHLLSLHAAHLTPTQTHTSHLSRLLYAPLARSTYLTARSTTLALRTRAIIFEGDLLAYTTALSFIYFTLIRNTVSTFQTCFPLKDMSAVVVWAKGWMDKYNEALGRGLGCVEVGGGVWKDCVSRAREMVGELDGVGLGFGECLGRGVEGVEEWLRELKELEDKGIKVERESEREKRAQSVGRRGAVAPEG